MRYEKDGENHCVFVEEGEEVREVLRALVKASFELAIPVGMGFMHFEKDTVMSNEMADQYINLEDRYGDVIGMDYVQGRQCKTFFRKIDDGCFRLANSSYERDRGTPEIFLERAKEIFNGRSKTDNKHSFDMYSGESLDLRLKDYNLKRNLNESDWDFRKRIFPDLFSANEDMAMEFLMGASVAEWNEMDLFLCLAFFAEGKPTLEKLIKFADGFAADPIEMRKQHK